MISKSANIRKKAAEAKAREQQAKAQGNKSSPKYTFHIFSDATGGLATHTLKAVLTQFPTLDHEKKCHTFQRTRADIRNTFRAIHAEHTLVFYALVEDETKDEVKRICTKKKIPHFDLTSGLVDFISKESSAKALKEINALHKVDEGYLKRIEAMEFTANHDDGRRLETIHLADIILVGLSRVSKSPTSTYLGSLGYKVANVPVDPVSGFPEKLDAKLQKKIVALTLQPKILQKIRKGRLADYTQKIDAQKLAHLDYDDLKSVIHEVMFAEEEFRKRSYPILDITRQTVEENAAIILKLLKIKHQDLSFD